MDFITKEQRSAVMRRITRKDTRPEVAIRKLLHSLGYRFRLQAGELPGRPDIVFRPRRKVIFVHGCFWHQHRGCRLARKPKSNLDYWLPKLERNQKRDKRVRRQLRRAQWSSLVVWECQVASGKPLAGKLYSFLGR
jgi:DNA mismatch endonuclease, patch repair protein